MSFEEYPRKIKFEVDVQSELRENVATGIKPMSGLLKAPERERTLFRSQKRESRLAS